MINIQDYYLHSIIGSRKYQVKRLRSIFRDGCIKSRQLQKNKKIDNGYHKDDEICLTDPSAPKISGAYSSFELFIPNSLTLLLDRNVRVYRPNIIASENINEALRRTHIVTNIYDEVRTTSSIDTELIKGIVIPISSMYTSNIHYLLFYSRVFNFFVSMGASDTSLSSYATFHQGELRTSRKVKVIQGYTNEIVKLIKKNDLDISLYDYDDTNQEVKRLIL